MRGNRAEIRHAVGFLRAPRIGFGMRMLDNQGRQQAIRRRFATGHTATVRLPAASPGDFPRQTGLRGGFGRGT